MLAAVQGHNNRLGVCGDTGAWLHEGLKPAEALPQLKDRVLVIGLSDRSALGASGHNVALGTGAAEILQFLREMYRLQIKPSLMTVDGTGCDHHHGRSCRTPSMSLRRHFSRSWRNGWMRFPALQQVVLRPISDRPGRASKIDAALPTEAPAETEEATQTPGSRFLNVTYGGHRSIPAENYGLEMMGKKTGAYEVMVENDNLDNLKYQNFKGYDAIFLNNTELG